MDSDTQLIEGIVNQIVESPIHECSLQNLSEEQCKRALAFALSKELPPEVLSVFSVRCKLNISLDLKNRNSISNVSLFKISCK